LANQDVPFEKLVEELHLERTLSHNPLIQVMFTMSTQDEATEFGGLRFENVRVDSATAKHDLILEVEEQPEGITLAWKYNTDLFKDETIERMSGHFLTLLQSILQNPYQNISQLNLLTPAEKDQLLQKWNQTELNIPKNRRLEEIFQEQVDATPKSIAVVAGKQQISYKELDTKSNQLAHYLIRNRIGPGKIVALFMERSIEMCVALLGIMKSGACYLPIDITYPADRIEFMLQDSKACTILTQKSLRSKLNQEIPIICVDSDWKNIQNEKKERLTPQGKPEDLIYIIYTSGSTGTPKGVMVRHRNVVNHALGVRSIYELRADDRALQFNSISFDVAGEELYSALLTGATVVLRTEQMLASFHAFLREVDKYKITFLNLPTAYWHELVQEIQASSFQIPSCVRVVIVGGEKVSYSAYKQWLNIAESSVLFFNGYGPTETTITSTIYKDSSINRNIADRIQDVPIGRPIPNTRIYVLDSKMQPVPVGVPGELWIGGAGVSCGYLNREELTKTRFVADPFVSEQESFIYKTGDLVRYLSDGNLQFFGRIDNQVKIRGFRVELGEIEAALLQHESVRETAVTAPTLSGTTHIVAYVVCHNKQATSKELRDFLNSKLPDYMVPTTFIFLNSLPLTATGKIDRRNLPLPENLDAELQTNYVPPGDELELKLAGIWQKLLNVTKVGMKDNFFDLGGHSLLAVRLFSQIEKETGKNLPLATLFEAPTVEQLAHILREEGWEAHWSSLVPIQPNGKRSPFFCIHAVGGNVIGYRPLAEYLSADQPVYGLQARGLDGKEIPHIVLEEMAADYIREIKHVQPIGPYHVGGLSSGGVVAFEIARQLIENGDDVGVVAMFDTEAPSFLQLVPTDTEIHQRGWSAYLERARYHLGMVFLNKEWKTHVKKKFKTVRRRIRTRLRLANYNLQRKTGNPLPNVLLRVQEASTQALRNYHPGYYPGDVTLFLAIQRSVGEQVPPEIGWKPFAQSVRVCSVPGDHLGILKEPNVRKLAESLQECLDEFSTKVEKKLGILMYLLFTLFQLT
jgi:amino acid adenylation domain-containing protein